MNFFGIGAAETLNATGNVIEKAGGVFDKLFTSDNERLSRAEIMARIKQEPGKWAHELNLINAKDGNLFNSGWRPAIGWVLAVATFVYFIPKFIVSTYVWAVICLESGELSAYPITFGELSILAGMMLGSKVMRSYDKKQGNAK
jgi:hypothetical protein